MTNPTDSLIDVSKIHKRMIAIRNAMPALVSPETHRITGLYDTFIGELMPFVEFYNDHMGEGKCTQLQAQPEAPKLAARGAEVSDKELPASPVIQGEIPVVEDGLIEKLQAKKRQTLCCSYNDSQCPYRDHANDGIDDAIAIIRQHTPELVMSEEKEFLHED